jgi:hypothetical protein
LDQKKRRTDVATTSIVYVHWVDAVADVGWQETAKAEVHDCHTVGYIVDETPEALCVASTISDKDSNARMHIPKAWIKKRKVIKLETEQRKVQRKGPSAAGTRSHSSQVSS